MWSLKVAPNGTVAKSISCTREMATRSIRSGNVIVSPFLCIGNFLHKDHVRGGRSLPHGLQFRIPRIIPPATRRLSRIEAYDHDSLRLPASFKHFHSPAANQVAPPSRSEEHTSELQSRGHLVCRLL